MGALQMTKVPTFYPETDFYPGFPSHHVESRSPHLLLQGAGVSASSGGHVCSPTVPLPGVYVPEKWFSPNKGPEAFDFAIFSNEIHDSASRNGWCEHMGLHNSTNLKQNKPEISTNSGSFGSVFEYTTPIHNTPDGKLNLNAIQEKCHVTSVLARVTDYLPVETLGFFLEKCTMDKDIAGGRIVHLLIVSNGFDFIPKLCDNLIRLFGLCASLVEADQLFSKLTVPSVSAWYTIMAAHSMNGDNEKVLQIYTRMVHASIAPNSYIFTCVVNSCASLRALTKGEAVHNDIIHSGLQSDLFVANALIGFYSKCGSLSKAHNVFVVLPKKNVVVWSSMIGAFVQEGCLEQSLELLREMKEQGVEPNEYTYSSLISACGNADNVVQGLLLHNQFIKSGLNIDSHMASTLINMYAKCGRMMEAHDVFADLSNLTVICWNTLIAGYARNEHDLAALEVYDNMGSEGFSPNSSTFCCSLRACGNLKALEKGRAIHDQIVTNGLDSDDYIQCNLIDMYSKCGCLVEARSVFDHLSSKNIVLWGALMAGYVQHDHNLPALEFFAKMQNNDIKPNVYIYSSVLQACGSLGALKIGIDIHEQIRKSGLEVCDFLGSSLIGMYSKCGNLETARAVFEELPSQNIVCWGAMIGGYAQHGLPLAAFGLYEEMVSDGMRPDNVIYMYVLEACSIMGSSDHGKGVHDQIIASGLGSDIVVGNSLLHMYIKCNCLQEAQTTFQALGQRNKISWDAMVVAYSQNSNFAMARNCLRGMAEEGFVADEILFTDILVACRRIGNVEEAWKFFKMINSVYGMDPCIDILAAWSTCWEKEVIF